MKNVHIQFRTLVLPACAAIFFAFAPLLQAAEKTKATQPAAQPTQEASAPSTYGELMLIEKKTEPVKAWQLELSGMQEFSNPYLDVNGVSASAKKSIGRFVFVGPEYTRYFAKDSEVSKNVSASLRTDTISQTVYRPKDSIYGVVSVVPIAGHLNFFSQSSLPFELAFSVGYGSVQYQQKPNEAALLWRVGPRAFLSELFGIQMEFGQELEAPFSGSKVTKSHARVGLVTRF